MSERRLWYCFDPPGYTIIPPISEETKRKIREMRRDPTHATYMKRLKSLGITSREDYEWKEPPSVNPEFISVKDVANRVRETHKEEPEGLLKYLLEQQREKDDERRL